jgi:hypothetical protein
MGLVAIGIVCLGTALRSKHSRPRGTAGACSCPAVRRLGRPLFLLCLQPSASRLAPAASIPCRQVDHGVRAMRA